MDLERITEGGDTNRAVTRTAALGLRLVTFRIEAQMRSQLLSGGLPLVAVVVAAMAVALPAGAKTGVPAHGYPPNGVYTCEWIAAHPTEATLARVSCNPDMTNPGSSVSPADVAAADLANRSFRSGTMLGSGCPRVPSSGAIGQGVFASTSPEYSSFWQWPAGSQHGYFTWYIKKNSDDSTWDWGSQFDGDFKYTTPNIYYWKVQNNYSNAQYWDCVAWSG